MRARHPGYLPDGTDKRMLIANHPGVATKMTTEPERA
jgi:hypothetical protein